MSSLACHVPVINSRTQIVERLRALPPAPDPTRDADGERKSDEPLLHEPDDMGFGMKSCVALYVFELVRILQYKWGTVFRQEWFRGMEELTKRKGHMAQSGSPKTQKSRRLIVFSFKKRCFDTHLIVSCSFHPRFPSSYLKQLFLR